MMDASESAIHVPSLGPRAQPNVTHLRQLMRYVFTHRAEARAKGQAARRYIKDHFSPRKVACQLRKLIVDMQQRAARMGLEKAKLSLETATDAVAEAKKRMALTASVVEQEARLQRLSKY